jgi:hypothetical protein
MLRTIDFNRQLQLISVEVDDVGADCILPAEFEMSETLAAEPTPQLRLTRRWVLPHSLARSPSLTRSHTAVAWSLYPSRPSS